MVVPTGDRDISLRTPRAQVDVALAEEFNGARHVDIARFDLHRLALMASCLPFRRIPLTLYSAYPTLPGFDEAILGGAQGRNRAPGDSDTARR